jgi:hypothetical protein
MAKSVATFSFRNCCLTVLTRVTLHELELLQLPGAFAETGVQERFARSGRPRVVRCHIGTITRNCGVVFGDEWNFGIIDSFAESDGRLFMLMRCTTLISPGRYVGSAAEARPGRNVAGPPARLSVPVARARQRVAYLRDDAAYLPVLPLR